MSSVTTSRVGSTSSLGFPEVVTDGADDAHLGEEARREGKVNGRAAKHPLALPEWRSN